MTEMPGNYVQPTIVEIAHDADIVKTELFVPILYVLKFCCLRHSRKQVIKFKTLSEAIEWNNEVPQGLSSALFTTNQSAIFQWTGYVCSHCLFAFAVYSALGDASLKALTFMTLGQMDLTVVSLT